MKKKKMILILVLLLTIGFASISTTLVLNGVIGISNKKDDFKVIFTNAKLDGVERQEFIDETTKQTLTYETNKLTKLEETTVLEYEVANTSRLYDASVSITCNIVDDSGNQTTSEYVSMEHTPNNMIVAAGETKRGSIITKLIKVSTEDRNIKVKCTLNANATERTSLGKEYSGEYKEVLLNGADPVIKEGLVPVTIENDGTVKKADTTSEWYSYENKKWANAVILSDETINYNENEVIPESNIESYFVWVPKYKYKLWNVESTETATNKGKHSIEIEFGTTNTGNVEGVSCVTPMTSGSLGECNNGEWMTHPAFISLGVNGIWVGKFETTGSTSNATVKPGETSLKKLNIKAMFDTAYNYKRSLESHMMKNTEWGAVAILSHSKYGIDSEVNINNNSNYLTGYSAVEGTDQSSYPGTYGTDESVTLPYNTETGYKASTTGNITGVYDMSGGAYEYTASYMDGYGVENSGNPKVASGFTANDLTTYAKYLDVYSPSSEIRNYQYRILGDATGEVGPFLIYADRDGTSNYHNYWYAELSDFVDSSHPWFHRGGGYRDGVLVGQFYFSWGRGASGGNISFRLVLA